ncbi:MAG: TetR/AcrR family transcriptional regulator [Oscillospiraceae bacterium]
MARNKYPQETIDLILKQALELFIEKGYDNTSIQDIIDNLGGLSKGAIYHHFKSKEEIFEGVCGKLGAENTEYYNKIRDDRTKNGYEKLKAVVRSAYANPNNQVLLSMSGHIMSDPKFLMAQIKGSYELVSPFYIEPIIRQGVLDGSLKTDHPKELAEVIITLLNVWLNPMIIASSTAELKGKLEFFDILLKGVGVDLFDQEIMEQYLSYCQQYEGVRSK